MNRAYVRHSQFPLRRIGRIVLPDEPRDQRKDRSGQVSLCQGDARTRERNRPIGRLGGSGIWREESFGSERQSSTLALHDAKQLKVQKYNYLIYWCARRESNAGPSA
jgi:hypothetical protein